MGKKLQTSLNITHKICYSLLFFYLSHAFICYKQMKNHSKSVFWKTIVSLLNFSTSHSVSHSENHGDISNTILPFNFLSHFSSFPFWCSYRLNYNILLLSILKYRVTLQLRIFTIAGPLLYLVPDGVFAIDFTLNHLGNFPSIILYILLLANDLFFSLFNNSSKKIVRLGLISYLHSFICST